MVGLNQQLNIKQNNIQHLVGDLYMADAPTFTTITKMVSALNYVQNDSSFNSLSSLLMTGAVLQYLGNTREIFMVTVMGEELYIATSAQDVSSIYKASKAFDFNPIINDIFEGFGITASTMQKMYEPNWGQGKHWIDIIHGIFKEQMHPGEQLVRLETTFLRKIDDCLSWDRLSGAMVLSEPSNHVKVVSLYKWTYEVLVSAASTSIFGNAILDVNPDLL
ncbi:cytochrome P450 protein [Rutstroemia sp. NJR-2017a BVV2]|nr:cytochrome P450 protein [Rutstroemia sp. NJR-2017a BVV2]